MKSNEIRIGNYYLQDGEYRKVDANTILNTMQQESANKCSKITSIPITKEILEKCGFEINNNQAKTIIDDWLYVMIDIDKEVKITISTNINDFTEGLHPVISILHLPIAFLHELQNLYFVLTRRELEVKL